MNTTAQFQAPDSMSKQISQHLGKEIIKGRLKPLERIQEMKVSNELGVSRGSVREALLILQSRHLVEIIPRKGAMVSAITPHHIRSLYPFYAMLLDMLVTSLTDHWTEFSELLPLLSHLEGLDELEPETFENNERILDAGFNLMREAAKQIGNPYLQEALNKLQPAIHRICYLILNSQDNRASGTLNFLESLVLGVTQRDHDLLKTTIKTYTSEQQEAALSALAKLS